MSGLLQLALSRTREYDADLGAVMLTGDAEGLALALVKLERQQRGIWEAMALPGGRIPDPSLLRSHPRTQERIARLMRLKGLPQGVVPSYLSEDQPPRRRRQSPVPKIGRRIDPRTERELDHVARLVAAPRDGPLHEHAESDTPLTERPIHAPAGRPRIRVHRGGVWW